MSKLDFDHGYILALSGNELKSGSPHGSTLATFIESCYSDKSPEEVGRLSTRRQSSILSGAEKAHNVYQLRHDDGAIGAMLALSIITPDSDPEFYRQLDEKRRSPVGNISAYVYTHEMAVSPERRGKRDIHVLREHALRQAGLDMRTDPLVLLGEFQSLNSLGVQMHLPGSVSVLAGEHVPSPNGREVTAEELAALKHLAHTAGRSFIERHHPNSKVLPSGVVESSVFEGKAFESDSIAIQKINRLQNELDGHFFRRGRRFASGIGATLVNI